MSSWFTRRVIDPVTAVLAYGVYYVVRVLPLDVASGLGSCLARWIGPLLPVQKVARKNLMAAFPEKSAEEISKILVGMWDNLGRTFFEYAHIETLIKKDRIQVLGAENIATLRDDGKAGVFWGAHLGNWELISAGAAMNKLEVHRFYRRPNNPYIEGIFQSHRNVAKGELLPKGAQGARRGMVLLKAGGHIGMLVDQKMNDGIAVPFFGRQAMTAPALAAFALRYKCPVASVRVVRLGGAHFRLEISAPYMLETTGDRTADELAAMTSVNQSIESWIREYPEQWLWVHRRWPKDETLPLAEPPENDAG